MNRQEHLAWCKQRAHAYVDMGDTSQAWASMVTDLRKHPGTQDHPDIKWGVGLMNAGYLKTKEEMRDFIEGFN